MNNPKRQHWVPRLYLRSFATPDTVGADDPDVWLFHKDKGDPFRTSISNVAVELFLYSSRTANGERDFDVENRLRDLEGVIAPLWRRFAQEFVDLEDSVVRKGVGLFLATLFHRNPQRIDDHSSLIETLKSSDSKPGEPAGPSEGGTASELSKKAREELKDGFVHTLLK